MAEGDQRKTFLLAYDGSDSSQRALGWFAEKLDAPDRRLLLLWVAEPPPYPRGNSTLLTTKKLLYAELVARAAVEIDEAKRLALALCRRLSIKAPVEFLDRFHQQPGRAIAAVARERHCGCVLLGCRGLGGFKRLVLGSVSDYVVRHSHMPVLVVPMRRRANSH